MPESSRVFVDDLLLYKATAVEYGEAGETVDITAPGSPSEWIQKGIGTKFRLRLEYDSEEAVFNWYTLESITEALDGSQSILRFILLEET